jgi:hypothetical protein
MNRGRLLNIIRNPAELNGEADLELLKELAESFPYYPSAYGLLTRLLSQQKSIYTDKYVRLSAAYAGDREVLYHLVHAAAAVPAEEIISASASNAGLSLDNAIPETAASDAPRIEAGIIPIEQAVIEETLEKGPYAEDDIASGREADNPEISAAINISDSPKTSEIEETHLEANPETTPASPVEELKVVQAEVATPEENNHVDTAPPAELAIPTLSLPLAEPEKPAATHEDYGLHKLELLPLTAYDYFAYQSRNASEKKARAGIQSEKTDPEEPAVSSKSLPDTAFDKTGKLSFGGWLDAISHKNEASKSDKKEGKLAAAISEAERTHVKKGIPDKKPSLDFKPKADRHEMDDIISKFIRNEPKIKPKPARIFSAEDAAQRSSEEDNSLVTETLANIYIKQGLDDKAIDIFEKLILRFPQKSFYFTQKINELKNK